VSQDGCGLRALPGKKLIHHDYPEKDRFITQIYLISPPALKIKSQANKPAAKQIDII